MATPELWRLSIDTQSQYPGIVCDQPVDRLDRWYPVVDPQDVYKLFEKAPQAVWEEVQLRGEVSTKPPESDRTWSLNYSQSAGTRLQNLSKFINSTDHKIFWEATSLRAVANLLA